MARPDPIYRYLDENGDGTGNKNANVDGSVTPVYFKFNADGNIHHLVRMIVNIRDSANMSADNYGNILELTNGLTVALYNASDDSVKHDYTAGLPIKSNADWARVCYDVDADTFGSGDDFVAVRWTFIKAGQAVIVNPDTYFAVKIQDNLTGLVNHTFMVQGWTEK